MSELKMISETGGFYVEFNGTFCGTGQVAFELENQTHELRRDKLQQLRGRVLHNLTLTVKVKLAAGDRFWELLCADGEQAEALCCAGGNLCLYPVDTLRRGYVFERVFLEKVKHLSGSGDDKCALDLFFTAENGSNGSWKFSRLQAGVLPSAVSASEHIPIARITRKLMDFLKQELKAVPGQNLCLNFPAPGQGGSYLLKLQKCSDFHYRGTRKLDYTLAAVFPVAEKNEVDSAMAELAEKLNGFCLDETDLSTLRCRVKNLDLSRVKSSNGRSVTDTVLEFSVLNE